MKVLVIFGYYLSPSTKDGELEFFVNTKFANRNFLANICITVMDHVMLMLKVQDIVTFFSYDTNFIVSTMTNHGCMPAMALLFA